MNEYLSELWIGHFTLPTIAAMVADLCESLECIRLSAGDEPVLTDICEIAEDIARSADEVHGVLEHIAAAVAYCEAYFSTATTAKAFASAGVYADTIAEARTLLAQA